MNYASRPPVVHEVKCTAEHYDALVVRVKKAELRFDDRHYEEGDFLYMAKVQDSGIGGLRSTGDAMLMRITHKLSGGQYGLADGHCMLSLELMATYKPAPAKP